MVQNYLPLLNKLKEHTAARRVRLHVPGHAGGIGLPSHLQSHFFGLASFDLTELAGLDDLHNPTGVIKDAQEMAARLMLARRTFFLVNGASSGVQAMLLATCGPGDTVLVARNAHESVYHGLIFCGARVRYLPVAVDREGFPLNVTVQAVREALKKWPETKAVLITSPSYHGVCADLKAIANVIMQSSEALLLLDEAHGAHLGLHPDLPAVCGQVADLRVQSWHKTLGALTPGAVLHQHGEKIDINKLEAALRWVQTSSPSYPLLMSLDAVREEISSLGERLYAAACEASGILRDQLYDRIPLIERNLIKKLGFELDITRLTLLTGKVGLNGISAAKSLAADGVDVEIAFPDHLLAVFGPGYRGEDNERVIRAFTRLQIETSKDTLSLPLLPEPKTAVIPRTAALSKITYIELQDSAGHIAAGTVAACPPGIPVLAPGELITEEIVEYLNIVKEAGVTWRGTDSRGRLPVCMQGKGEEYA